eukprot:UC4_evm4s379
MERMKALSWENSVGLRLEDPSARKATCTGVTPRTQDAGPAMGVALKAWIGAGTLAAASTAGKASRIAQERREEEPYRKNVSRREKPDVVVQEDDRL